MKFTIGFKTPDAIFSALNEHRDYPDDSDDDGVPLSDEQKEELEEKLRTWIKYGENVSIEFDLETMTAKVLKA